MSSENTNLRICFLAPPFLSHLMPMLSLAQALNRSHVEVTIACSSSFKKLILSKGLHFDVIRINLNANEGSVIDTDQEQNERKRLNEFFDATRKGAVETLATQMRHRTKDMFANPDEVFDSIQDLSRKLHPQMWFVDQLSYSATIALMALDLPFVTFCPPHPASIPEKDKPYGLPVSWPERLNPDNQEIKKLTEIALQAEHDFDGEVHMFLSGRGYGALKINKIFSLSSPFGIVFNYPQFKPGMSKEKNIHFFMGFSFDNEPLDSRWENILSKNGKPGKKIYLSLGTFLSERNDVLKKMILIIRDLYPDVLLIVAAGPSLSKLESLRSDKTIIEDFLPQKAIIPYMDVIIHHGGVGTFTESLFHSKTAIVLPFSSDQFNVATDVEVNKLGVVLDPNNFTRIDIQSALKDIFSGIYNQSVEYWSRNIRSLGPENTAVILLEKIEKIIYQEVVDEG